ncbi:hypothetical protein FC831_13650 [Clostridium botulinum]|nr:hypothetical protein [Clostridium botulinum]
MSRVIIGRCYSGVCDLYHGVPNLKDAKITRVESNIKNNEYEVVLYITDKDSINHKIILLQDRVY